jgi:hypothetical protein
MFAAAIAHYRSPESDLLGINRFEMTRVSSVICDPDSTIKLSPVSWLATVVTGASANRHAV